MKFKIAITNEEFIKMYGNLQSQYPKVNFIDPAKTFYQPKDIYIWLANRYTDRVIRYGKKEFLRYFENILLSKLPELFVAQNVYLDAMISSIKDAKTRGVVSSAFANNYSTAATYAGKAIQLTKDDNVANKGQTNSQSNAVDYVYDILKVINIRLEKPIENFLDGFNDLFKQYLTEQELETIEENSDFFNNLITALKEGSNISFNIDKLNERLTINSHSSIDDTYLNLIDILKASSDINLNFDGDKKQIEFVLNPDEILNKQNIYKKMKDIVKTTQGLIYKFDDTAQTVSIDILDDQLMNQKNIYNIMKLIFSTSDDFDLNFDDDKFTLFLKLAKAYALKVDFDEFKDEVATNLKALDDKITSDEYKWVNVPLDKIYDFDYTGVEKVKINDDNIGVLSKQSKDAVEFNYSKTNFDASEIWHWFGKSDLNPFELIGYHIIVKDNKMNIINDKITKFEVWKKQ